MKLSKLTKDINIEDDTCKIGVEIVVDRTKGYEGFDVFDDKLIPGLFIKLSRSFVFDNGKLVYKVKEK